MKNGIFKKYEKPLRGGVLLPYLIEIRGRQCECCKNTLWLNKPINLQVHHIDGDKTNNKLENLQLLCLNCHSYTNNFGTKNRKQKEEISDEIFINALRKSNSVRQALILLGLSDAGGNYTRARKLVNENNISFSKKEKENYCKECGKMILPDSTYCKECCTKIQRVVERPTREELKDLIRNKPFTQIAAQYGVSDNAIRKWCDSMNLPRKKKDINSYSDEEWINI